MTMNELFDLVKNQCEKIKREVGTKCEYAKGALASYEDVLYRIDPKRWEAEILLKANGGV